MTEVEQRLAEFWRETEAPARDLVFELAVEERIARRRLVIDIANLGWAGVAALAIAWTVGPGLLNAAVDLASTFDAAGPVLAAVAAIGAVMAWLNRPQEEEA